MSVTTEGSMMDERKLSRNEFVFNRPVNYLADSDFFRVFFGISRCVYYDIPFWSASRVSRVITVVHFSCSRSL